MKKCIRLVINKNYWGYIWHKVPPNILHSGRHWLSKWVKWLEQEDGTHLHLRLRLRMSGTIPLFPPICLLGIHRTVLGLLDPEVKGTTVSCNAGNCLPVNTA